MRIQGQLHDLPDEDLMLLVRSGEARAFELMFDRHATVAYSLARRICPQEPIAEDVVREAFVSVWRDAGRFDPSHGSVRAWLLSVVRRHAIDAARQARTTDRPPIGDELAVEQGALTEVDVVGDRETHQLRQALDRLAPDERRVIELSYFDGLTDRQIARLLDLPRSTVKGRIRVGMKKLRASSSHAVTV